MFVRFIVGSAFLLLLSVPSHSRPFSEMFPGKKYDDATAQAFSEGLDYQQGKIALGTTNVSLNVPQDFYFLGEKDAKRVLIDAWGNPGDTSDGVLGMIFPARSAPLDDTWAAVITYDADGYVSDAEAHNIDYSSLLQQMREATTEVSAERTQQGYPTIRLVGWASPPFYDQDSHKLHWAKELEFGDQPDHTLNYDVRALGRRGVLKMNFVAQMKELPAIKQVIPAVMTIPEFEAGARYADFLPGTDKVAAYGIGGLIAGKVASKLGLLAIALVFLKKGWVLIVVALAGAFRLLQRVFRGREA